MFNGVIYKRSAVNQLRGNWKSSVKMSAVLLIFALLRSYVSNHSQPKANLFNNTMIFVFFTGSLGIFTAAQSYYYLKLTRTSGKMTFTDFLVGISEYWMDGIISAFYKMAWLFLWFCLFIIPFFVKAIAYSMMKFVIVENPGISIRKALKISRILTDGHKGDLFLMYLSFTPWILLTVISIGIGSLWLLPYINTCLANAYNSLKEEALRMGKLVPADFE